MSNNEIINEIASRTEDLINEYQKTTLVTDADELGNIDQSSNMIRQRNSDIRPEDLIQPINECILPMHIHSASLNTLQQLPQFLSEMVLSKKLPIGLVGPDHYSYWAWSAAVVSFVQDKYRKMGPDALDSPFEEFGELLPEYYSLVHMVLLPIKHQDMDMRTRIYFSSMNPSVGKLNEKYTLRFAGNTGFQLLEGLIRKHSNIINEDGTPNRKYLPLKKPWESGNGEHTEPNESLQYNEELHVWRCYSTLDRTVKDTLDKINDMDQDIFGIDDLIKKFGKDEEITDEIKRQYHHTKNFFDIMSKNRNYTLHGQGSIQIAGILILNLCSLLFWDAISEQDYNDIREELIIKEMETYLHKPVSELINQSTNIETSRTMSTIQSDTFDKQKPIDFYPIYRPQSTNILQQMEQRLSN